jgi:hypothetical protein
MPKLIAFIVSAAALILAAAYPAYAELDYHHNGFSIGAGINQATENQADETWAVGLKYRQPHWQYGVDVCMSEDFGGVGDNKFGFIWATYIEEWERPAASEYGLYSGIGAGAFFLEDEFVDWPAGPIVVMGWDWGRELGMEAKVGYFGENFYGTTLLYWYF